MDRSPIVAENPPGSVAGAMLLRADLGSRLRAEWRVKLVAIPVLMTAFFAAYFLILKRPLFAVSVMPLIHLDQLIPFWPGALLLYVSLWIYVLLPAALLRERAELFTLGRAVIGLALVGLGIFVVCPTAVPLPQVDWGSYPAFAFLRTMDATGNACPSLHVAFAFFSALWLHRILRGMGDRGWFRILSWSWCLGIAYSTLATKQHVALDVLAGTVLGTAAALLGMCPIESKAR